jgi:hypothetical protein
MNRKGNKIAGLLAGAGLILIGLAGNSTAADTFDGLKNAYGQGISQLDNAEKAGKPALDSQYLRTVDDFIKKSMSAGDLEATVAGQKEQKRFQEEKTIPAESPADLRDGIVKLQDKYREALKTQAVEKDRKQKVLAEQYVAKLKPLVKKLTMDSRMDEATIVNEEIKKVELVLADLTSRLPAEKPATAGTAVVVQPAQSSATNAIPMNGLILYYSFDKDENGKVTDKSGKGNNGVVEKAKWTVRGKFGGAYEFNGKESCVTVSNIEPFDNLTAMTVSAWFYLNRYPQDFWGIVSRRCPGDIWWLGVKAGYGVEVNIINPANGGVRRTAKKTVEAHKWCHVVFTYQEGQNRKIYINGQVVDSLPISGPMLRDTSIPVRIGRGFDTFETFNGTIDEVMIFNRALSDEEVSKLYDPKK